MTPTVTVVVPAFNRANRIPDAVSSLQRQTYTDWEAIVVDDGSNDGTSDVAVQLAREDNRLRVIRLPMNRGAQAARNAGIRAARTPWVTFLDSDDRYLPHSLELRLDAARRCGSEVVHSGCVMAQAGDAVVPYRVPPLEGRVYDQLLQREGPVFPTLLVSAAALWRIDLLDERIVAFQEWDTSIRLAKREKFAFEPTPTFVYDCRGAGTISKDKRRGARGYEQVLRKHLGAMFRSGGAATVARHYTTAARWYRDGEAFSDERRCRAWAQAWSCLDPAAVRHRLSASVSTVRGSRW